MNATQTISTTFAADADLIEALRQSIDATGETYPNAEGAQVPYILAEREVSNGSGRVVGVEYTVTDETYGSLVEAVSASLLAGDPRVDRVVDLYDTWQSHRSARYSEESIEDAKWDFLNAMEDSHVTVRSAAAKIIYGDDADAK